MTGDEALRILNQVTQIHNFLIKGNDRSAFFHMGMLSEELAMIVRIDETSLAKKSPRIYADEEE